MILNLFNSAENVRTSADQGLVQGSHVPGTDRDGQFGILNLSLVDKVGIHNPSYVQKKSSPIQNMKFNFGYSPIPSSSGLSPVDKRLNFLLKFLVSVR